MILGSIIRRLVDNKYLVVLKTTAKNVTAVLLDGEELGEEVTIPKKYCTECTIASLLISPIEMDKLIDGDIKVIIHEALKTWCNAVDLNPEIIKLFDIKGRFVYYSNCSCEKIIKKRLVSEHVRKNERDIIAIIPSVRIKLSSMIYAEWD